MTATILDFDLLTKELEQFDIVCDLFVDHPGGINCEQKAEWVIKLIFTCNCAVQLFSCTHHKEMIIRDWNRVFQGYACMVCNANMGYWRYKDVVTSIEKI